VPEPPVRDAEPCCRSRDRCGGTERFGQRGGERRLRRIVRHFVIGPDRAACLAFATELILAACPSRHQPSPNPEVQLGLSRLVSDARGRVLAHDQRRKVTSLQPRHDNQRPDAPVPTR
jgi:hypothetical protein